MRLIRPAAGFAAVLATAVAVDGAQAASVPVVIQGDQPVSLVDQGATAHVGIRLITAGGVPTDRPVRVGYSTGGGITFGSGINQRTLADTAVPDEDYTPVRGSVTFPAGTESGAVQTVDVPTLADTTTPEKAETVTLQLTNPDADAALSEPSTPPSVVINAHGFPYLDASRPVSERVADLLGRMSVDEKIGQTTQPERGQMTSTATTSNVNVNNIAAWSLGSLLSGGGSVPPAAQGGNTPAGWANMIDDFQLRALRTPLQVPLVYGIDSVHGNNNLLGATIFPHNIGMGATRNPALVEQEGHVAAEETRAVGPQWAFAPCLCVARDDRWGRTYESYGEDPALVSSLETSIDGFQGTTPGARAANDRVLATAKHYAGDGGTKYGTGDSGYRIDQGITITSRDDFDRLFVAPYEPAVREHHVGSIMPSYSSVDFTDDGVGNPVKMHAQKELLTDVLKQRIGFDGFLISDFDALNQIATPDKSTTPNPTPQQITASIDAGLDMIMVPNAYRTYEKNLKAVIDQPGGVPMSRLDDAVARILRQKFELGLFEHPFTDRSNAARIGSDAHRAVARDAVAQSQVLLKNTGGLLPVGKDAKIYLAGTGADDMHRQTGGWTVTWQGRDSSTPAVGTTIRQGIAQVAPDAQVTYSADGSAAPVAGQVGVVVVSEQAYAEGQGDVGASGTNPPAPSMSLSGLDQLAVERVCSAMPCAVFIVSGRPLTLPTAQARNVRALVASFLPGTEGEGVADVLFGDKPFTGRLPVTWPRTQDQEPINVGDADYDPAYPFGWGLRTDASRGRLQRVHDELAASGEGRARAAAGQLEAVLGDDGAWTADGTARRQADVLRALDRAAAQLDATDADSARLDDQLVTVARDIAQAAMVRGGTPADAASLSADAEAELLRGHVERAVALLIRASGVDAGTPAVAQPQPATAPAEPAEPAVIDRRVSIGRGTLRVDRHRRAKVTITCGPSAGSRCQGVVQLLWRGRELLARRSFAVTAGRPSAVTLTLSRSAAARLRRDHVLRASVIVLTRGSDLLLRRAERRRVGIRPV